MNPLATRSWASPFMRNVGLGWAIAQQRRQGFVTLTGKLSTRANPAPLILANGLQPATNDMCPASYPRLFRYSLAKLSMHHADMLRYKARPYSQHSPGSPSSYATPQPPLPVSSYPMAHPKTYKAYAFFEKGGDLQPLIFDWRDPEPGEVVVKVLACSVCGG